MSTKLSQLLEITDYELNELYKTIDLYSMSENIHRLFKHMFKEKIIEAYILGREDSLEMLSRGLKVQLEEDSDEN